VVCFEVKVPEYIYYKQPVASYFDHVTSSALHVAHRMTCEQGPKLTFCHTCQWAV